MHSSPARAYRDDPPSDIFVIEESRHLSNDLFAVFHSKNNIEPLVLVVEEPTHRLVEIGGL